MMYINEARQIDLETLCSSGFSFPTLCVMPASLALSLTPCAAKNKRVSVSFMTERSSRVPHNDAGWVRINGVQVGHMHEDQS